MNRQSHAEDYNTKPESAMAGAHANEPVKHISNVERMNEAIQRMQSIYNRLDTLLAKMNQTTNADDIKQGAAMGISFTMLMDAGPSEIHNRIDDIMNQIEMVERSIYGG